MSQSRFLRQRRYRDERHKNKLCCVCGKKNDRYPSRTCSRCLRKSRMAYVRRCEIYKDVGGKKMQEEIEKKEKGIFQKLWDKTIFSDMQKEKNERREMERELRKEALEEAHDELKKLYKEQIIQKERERIMGQGKGAGVLKKLGEEFSSMGKSAGEKDIGAMMGGRRTEVSTDKMGNTGIVSDEKIKRMLGR